MGLFGFGKKKKQDDKSENLEYMEQEASAMEEVPEDNLAPDEDEAEEFYRLGLQSQDDGDDAAAFQYLKKAAESGHMLAQFTLGTIYERGSSAVFQDREQALYWYKLAAEQGDAGSEFNIGYIYLGMSGKEEEGLAWMRRASEHGDEAAREYLASLASEKDRKERMKEQRSQNLARSKKLLSRKELFAIFSPVTNAPYLEEDGDHYALVYDSEQHAIACRDRLLEEGLQCQVMRIFKNNHLPFLGSLYGIGCNAVRFHEAEESFDVYLYDIVKIKKNKSNVQDRLAVENPLLIHNMLLLRQESAKKALQKEPGQAVIGLCQAEISKLLYQDKVKLILPYILTDQNGTKVQTPLLYQGQENNEPSRVVLLSNTDAFNTMKSKNIQLRRKVLTAEEAAKEVLPKGVSSFIVDPGGARLLIQVKKPNNE